MAKIFIPLVKKDDALDPDIQRALEIILTAGWQERSNPYASALLMLAAKKKATEMAERNYFSHTSPSGVSANANVRNTGYFLPDWYPKDGNNVESIYAGSCSPDEAIAAWLKSERHHIHLTGSDSFYRGQSAIGIGKYKGKDNGCRWVFLSAPAVGAT